MLKRNYWTVAPICLAISMGTHVPALSASLALEEVVVTAQRRAQSLQDVPIAVSAFSSETLKESDINYVTDLMAYTPGLTGARQGVGVTQFAIRGISSNSYGVGGDNSVGIFVDDVYAGRATIAGLPFLDTARVEVLKGPQGSLFGRNTSAGAISITSNKPNNTASLTLEQTIAQHDTRKTILTGNLPIIDDVFMLRGSYVYEQSQGFMDNPTLGASFGNQISAGKLSALWNISDALRATLSASAQAVQEDGRSFEPSDTMSPFLLLSGLPAGDVFDEQVNHGSVSDETNDVIAATLRIDWDVSDSISLSSISSSNEYVNNSRFDADGTPLRVLESIWPREESESIGQEFRLSGTTNNMTWMVGTSYFKEHINGEQINRYEEAVWLQILAAQGILDPTIPANGLGAPHPQFTLCDGSGLDAAILGASCGDRDERDLSTGDYENYAIYADMSLSLSDQLTLNAGVRYARDKKSWQYSSSTSDGLFNTLGLPAFILTDITQGVSETQSDSWTKLTPRLAVDYQINDEVMVYASVSQGFKAGGFSARNAFAEEETWSYELGLKSSLLDGRALFNAAVYYYDYDNLQAQVIRNSVLSVVNVPTMKGLGVEADLTFRVSDSLDIISTLAYSDTEIGDFQTDAGNLDGNTPSYAPENSASLIARYFNDSFSFADIIVRAEASYQSEQFFSIFNVADESQSAYTVFNTRIALKDKDERWELALFAKNLSDKDYLINAYGLTETVVQRGTPRQIGLQFSLTLD